MSFIMLRVSHNNLVVLSRSGAPPPLKYQYYVKYTSAPDKFSSFWNVYFHMNTTLMLIMIPCLFVYIWENLDFCFMLYWHQNLSIAFGQVCKRMLSSEDASIRSSRISVIDLISASFCYRVNLSLIREYLSYSKIEHANYSVLYPCIDTCPTASNIPAATTEPTIS